MLSLAAFICLASAGQTPPVSATIPLWTGKPPGDTKTLEPERDTSGPNGRNVAGKPVIRLGNVSTPALVVYKPEKPNGASVVICPGGGHQILAWDLEGTEVAEWLNRLGVTAFVLKYRVPFRDPAMRYRAAVQDAQRAISLIRSRAGEWNLDTKRIGILGFSAGGETATLATLLNDRLYEATDAADKQPYRADFAVLVYPAYLANKEGTALQPHVTLPKDCPPFLLIHAADDPVTSDSSLLLFQALKRAKVPAELHIFASGGHGYGLRPAEAAVTRWPKLAEDWLKPQLTSR